MSGVVREYLTGGEPNRYMAEASTLGLRPGEWPAQLSTSLGDGEPFVFTSFERSADGEVTGACYVQGLVKLIIFND